MFESTCSLPASSDIFTLALHPSKPLLTIGLASGHVETLEIPAPASANSVSSAPKTTPVIKSLWRTRRHKGSCRALAYQQDGKRLFSLGSDRLIKGFKPKNGKVRVKFAIETPDGNGDEPSSLLVLNPTTLVVASDSSWVTVWNIDKGKRLCDPLQPHGDFTTAMFALPPSEESTSNLPKQWVSAGENTVTISDMRKGVIDDSGEQDDLLTAMVYVMGLRAKKGSKRDGIIVTGSDQGIVKLFDPADLERPVHKIKVHGGESIDSMVEIPEALGLGRLVACGFGDGIIRVVDLRRKRVVPEMVLAHDNLQGEPVVGLGVDCYGRLISAGGTIVKVWEELSELQEEDEEENEGDDDEEEDDDEEDDSDGIDGSDGSDDDNDDDEKPKGSKRAREDSDEEDDSDEDSDGERSKCEEQREAAKKRKLGPMGAHGILKFDGLD